MEEAIKDIPVGAGTTLGEFLTGSVIFKAPLDDGTGTVDVVYPLPLVYRGFVIHGSEMLEILAVVPELNGPAHVEGMRKGELTTDPQVALINPDTERLVLAVLPRSTVVALVARQPTA